MDTFENDIITHKVYKDLEYIQFKKLNEFGIPNAYTLRGKQINYRRNCPEEAESYKKIFDALGLDVSNKIKPYQKHTNVVKCIDNICNDENLRDVDGLITNKENVVLSTTNADCILLFLYDPEKRVIANIHSGWRGTVQKISKKTIDMMINNYGCNAENIYCFICPSIRKDHFEVEEEVKKTFEKTFEYMNDKAIIDIGLCKNGVQKYLVDTVLINKHLLMDKGVLENHIYDSNICSMCHSDKINSCREQGENFKLSTAIISL